MVWMILLFSLAVYSAILSRILSGMLKKKQMEVPALRQELAKLAGQDSGLRSALAVESDKLSRMTTLYEITGEVCKSLDEEKLCNIFREQALKFFGGKINCGFFKSEVMPEDAGARTVLMPLSIEGKMFGYLSVSNLPEDEREQCHILGQQLILGLKRAELFKRVQTLAVTDSLTNTFSRRYWAERFREEIIRSKHFNYRFSFLMIDIDHFKFYNDHYGHLVGDVILRETAAIIRENIRQIDLLGRYGGEEFALILTETDKEGALFAGERIRHAIESRLIKAYDENLRITISIGVATFPQDASEMDSLVDRADKALYQAKDSGRNRVCAA
ncbi:MAG: GGDEF domain-containing protein [Candidatus Omnitrophota bacterium]